jgi:chromosome segregation ATPase
MTLTDFFNDVGSQFQDLFWSDAPRYRLAGDIDELKLQLRQQTAIMAAQQGVIDGARRRLTELEHQAAHLSARIEVYLHVGDQANAWKQALELDRVRRRIPSLRQQLREFRRTHYRQQGRVDELREELADLQARPYANR